MLETGRESKIAPKSDPIGSNCVCSKPIVDDGNDDDDDDKTAAGTRANLSADIATSESGGINGHPKLIARLKATLLSSSMLGCSGSVKSDT